MTWPTDPCQIAADWRHRVWRPDTDDSLDKSTILGMIAMAVSVFVIANDFTALSVALPAIEKTFDTSVTPRNG